MDAPASVRDLGRGTIRLVGLGRGRHRQRSVTRFRWLILALLMAVVFFAIAAPVLVVTFNQQLSNRTQLAITCTSARSDIEQLTALNEIADRLGIPHDFRVPEIPAECE